MNSKTILVVDDEPQDLQVVTEILESAGYRVVAASNYHQGIRMAQNCGNDLDVLIADVSLPGKNGIELFEEIATLCDRRPKVLFISGYTGSELLRRYGVSLTDMHFLAKPFSSEDLLDRVKRLETFQDLQLQRMS